VLKDELADSIDMGSISYEIAIEQLEVAEINLAGVEALRQRADQGELVPVEEAGTVRFHRPSDHVGCLGDKVQAKDYYEHLWRTGVNEVFFVSRNRTTCGHCGGCHTCDTIYKVNKLYPIQEGKKVQGYGGQLPDRIYIVHVQSPDGIAWHHVTNVIPDEG